MLHAIEVPRDATGGPLGDTLFASMTAAAAALSETERQKLVRLSAWHQYVYRFTTADQPLPGVAHPILLRHPLTAAECLYVNSGFTHRILGVAKARGAVLLNQLYAHARRDEFIYRHRWEVGDIVIWDNYSTQHCAVADYGPAQRRHMWRTTIQGFPLDDAASESEMMAESEAS
jgi:taurine dioxygenase